MTSERLFNSLSTPKNFYTPQKQISGYAPAVFAGLNQVSASLNRFKPHVWQKQAFAGRNPTLIFTLVHYGNNC